MLSAKKQSAQGKKSGHLLLEAVLSLGLITSFTLLTIGQQSQQIKKYQNAQKQVQTYENMYYTVNEKLASLKAKPLLDEKFTYYNEETGETIAIQLENMDEY